MTRRPPRSPLFPPRRSSDRGAIDALARTVKRLHHHRQRRHPRQRPPRSEEHTSELQSQSNLLFPLFFFNDTPPTEISPLSSPTLFRSGGNRRPRPDS